MKYCVIGKLRTPTSPPARQRVRVHRHSLDAVVGRGGMVGMVEADSPERVTEIMRTVFAYPLFAWEAYPVGGSSKQGATGTRLD